MFHELVDEMYVSLDGFGEILALDGKIIPSYAKGPNQNKQEDGRRDTEANFTIKQYTTTTPSGEKVTNKKKWFGYRLHLIIDATYELPIGYELTKASEGEPTVAKRLIKALPDAQLKSSNYLLLQTEGMTEAPCWMKLNRETLFRLSILRTSGKKRDLLNNTVIPI